jgi:hypothetical protein
MTRRILFALLGISLSVSAWAGRFEVETGCDTLSYGSNYTASGFEVAVPLSMRWSLSGGHLMLNAGTMFMKGDYKQSAIPDVNLPAAEYKADRLSDSTLGGIWQFQTGQLHNLAALQFNLPTGQAAWESNELNVPTKPGNLPLEFVPSRYRGRGFGMTALCGTGLEGKSSDVGFAAGYLRSGKTDLNTFQDHYDLKSGDYFLGAMTTGARFSGFGSIRLKVSHAWPSPSSVNDQESYISPAFTNVALSYGTGRSTHFSVDVSANLFGKTQVPNGTGGWMDETSASQGSIYQLRPCLQYPVSRSLRFESAATWKHVDANGYDQTDERHEGGGDLLGASQQFRIRLGSQTALLLEGAYDHILNAASALSAAGTLTAVAYHAVTVKSRVVMSW